jgi:hypothetical protein
MLFKEVRLMPEPRRNRVTPGSEVVAIPLRGAWTGNRGNLHRDGNVVRMWATHHWLICTLTWKDTWHEQWLPGRLTWLFFHDEAVALASGHRPCARCRRESYDTYREALGTTDGTQSYEQIDRRLHSERLVTGTHRRRLHEVPWTQLPDGAFVVERGQAALIKGRELIAWTPTGYSERTRRPKSGTAELLTPPSTLAAIQEGYPVQFDATVA